MGKLKLAVIIRVPKLGHSPTLRRLGLKKYPDLLPKVFFILRPIKIHLPISSADAVNHVMQIRVHPLGDASAQPLVVYPFIMCRRHVFSLYVYTMDRLKDQLHHGRQAQTEPERHCPI
jgi:hypothetical protein